MTAEARDLRPLADRMYAEAVAVQLRDPESFRRVTTSGPWNSIEPGVREATQRHAEDLGLTPVEVERALADARMRWTGKRKNEDTQSVALLQAAANDLLQQDGREMILKVDRKEPGREILRWRFVSLALPPSILTSAAATDGPRVPDRVRLLHDSMAPDSPVAHNHVHHSAMMSFDEIWESLRLRVLFRYGEVVKSLGDGRANCPGLHEQPCLGMEPEQERAKALESLTAAVGHARHMAQWADTLRQGFVAGRLLDLHAGHHLPLVDCNHCLVARTSLRFLLNGRVRPYRHTPMAYPWKDELIGLGRRWRAEGAEASARRWHSRGNRFLERQMERERNVLRRAFRHAGSTTDPLYEKLLLQYLRIKTQVFRLLVHRPGEPGLIRFLNYFQQIKVYAPEADLIQPRQVHEPGLRVRSTEYRVAPDAWLKVLQRAEQRDLRRKPRRETGEEGEEGWLVHFKRKNARRSLPLFGADASTMDAEADRILRAITADSRRLRQLCGIDVCGVEQAQPLWVSARTLHQTRARSRTIAAARPHLRLRPLRLTLHAGEDFRWLTSGMRAIAEPFHWNLVERGDRIGHGIAVTVDPDRWWNRLDGQIVPVKRFDRLLDLAFLAEYAGEKANEEQARWLRSEVRKTLEGLGLITAEQTDGDLVESAKGLWRDLGGVVTRRLMRWRDRPNGLSTCQSWIHRYLWSRRTQEKAAEEVSLECHEAMHVERDLLIEARKVLIHQVAYWQVCIESNPSSNLVVAGLDAMMAQDFLQKRPTEATAPGQEILTWTISTDDPITFSTSLADEYAYAWAGLVLRENNRCDPAYARALLDEAAATSMRMRFTTPSEDGRRSGAPRGA